MSRIPDEAMYIGNLAQELDNAFDEYEQKLGFYLTDLQTRHYKDLAEDFGHSEQEAREYKSRVLEDLEDTADQLQEIVQEAYPMVNDFEPQEFNGGEVEEFPNLDYLGPKKAFDQIEETLDRLRMYGENGEMRIPEGARAQVEDYKQGTLREKFGEDTEDDYNDSSNSLDKPEFPEDCTVRDLLADEDETFDISLDEDHDSEEEYS